MEELVRRMTAARVALDWLQHEFDITEDEALQHLNLGSCRFENGQLSFSYLVPKMKTKTRPQPQEASDG